jgi:TP901 family phage tail tape measure protein
MADDTREQLVIEAVLKDLVSKQAGEIVKALQGIEKAGNTGGGSSKPAELNDTLTKMVPIARRAGGEILAMTGELGKFGSTVTGSLREAGSVLSELGTGAGAAGAGLLELGATISGFAAVGIVLGVAAKNAYELDKAMNVVRVATDLSAKEQQKLNESIADWRKDGVDAEESANTLAMAYRFLTKDGKEAEASTTSVLKAFKVDVGQSGPAELMKATATATKAFGLTAADTDRVLGILYAGSQKTGASMVEFATALSAVAPYATVAKVSLEDTAATLAVTQEKAGGLGEASGALAQILNQVSRPTTKMSQDMRAFGIDTKVGADGLRDLHGILEQVGSAAQQDGGVLGVLSGGSRGASKIFASAKDDAKDYYDTLDKMKSGSIDLSQKEAKFSKVASEEMARALGTLGVMGSSFMEGVLQPVKNVALAVTGTWVEGTDEAIAKTKELGDAVSHVAKNVGHLDLSSPLERQIRELSATAQPLMLTAELSPESEKALKDDLATLQASLGDRAALKSGQVDTGTAQSLARVAQMISVIQQAQAISADLAMKGANGYAQQRMQVESVAQALTNTIEKLRLAGVDTTSFLAQAKAVTDEMTRATSARNSIENVSVQAQALQAEEQALTAAMNLAKAKGDATEADQLQLQIYRVEGTLIDLNAEKQRQANAEQFRGKQDLVLISERLTQAAKDQAEAQLRISQIVEARAKAEADTAIGSKMLEIMKSLSDSRSYQLDVMEKQRAVEREQLVLTLQNSSQAEKDKQNALELYDLQTKRMQEDLAGGFKSGMAEALRVYSDTAERMKEMGNALITSFHDEGAHAMADFVKGNVSGKGALKEFGQGVLGSAIDNLSSGVFDSLTGGLGGILGIPNGGKRGDPADKYLTSAQIFSEAVTRFAVSQGALGSFSGGPITGLFGGLFGGGGGSDFIGPPTHAMGGVFPGQVLSSFAHGGVARGRQTAVIGDNSSGYEAFVPLPGAGRGIPVEFRGRAGGGDTHVTAQVSLTVHSIDPRGAADVVLSQMPAIQKAITSALVRGSDRGMLEAVRGAAR